MIGQGLALDNVEYDIFDIRELRAKGNTINLGQNN